GAPARPRKRVRAAGPALARPGRFRAARAPPAAMGVCFPAGRASEAEPAAAIRTTLRETGTLIDPHTAVAIAVAEKESRDPAVPMVVLSTAHAAEFPDAVEAACGLRPCLPDWLRHPLQHRHPVPPLPPGPAASPP